MFRTKDKNFKSEIISLQRIIKDDFAIFIYYKELVELLRLVLDKPIALEDELSEILTKDYLGFMQINPLSDLTKKVIEEYRKRNKDKKESDQITITKDTLKSILSKYYRVNIEKVVISSDFEKIFLKIS